MSFLSDAFEGNWSHLGTDIGHAGSSLMSHPSELYETLGGAAALATGGLALGALAPEVGGAAVAGGGADVGGLFSGIFGDTTFATGAVDAGTPALGYGTQVASGLTNAAGESLGAVDPLAQGSADVGGSLGAGSATPAGFAPTDAELSGGITGAAPQSSQPGFFSGITDSLMHPTLKGVGQGLGVAAAGAGLGMNMLHGNQVDPYQQKLQDSANQLGAQGQVLESYLRTGKLPPALQAQLDQWETSKRAQIIAGAAARGQPTDPLMNSALAQDLSNLKLQGLAQMAEVQVNLLNAGLKETGLSMNAYQTITQMDQKQQEDLMKSIQNMAMALSGGFGGAPSRAAA